MFILFAFLFSLAVYLLDNSLSIRPSNASYILAGWLLLFTIFIGIDYFIYNSRIKKFKDYCRLNASTECSDEFFYPSDKEYAKAVWELAVEYEKYKADNYTKAVDEMEFITKWLHDVRVPISAAKLILENHENHLPKNFYQNIYTEIFSIEESIQKVFFEMKSNQLYDDYKITNASTKKLIAQALKGYSNFFSYKKIHINIEGEDYKVLTDEKWSGYVLSQIISNAVKYSPIGGRICIHTNKEGRETTISIKNNGRGILDKDIGQLFKKGYTSSENRDGIKATGYGLYLSKKLSDLLGHQLTVKSLYNEYAEFSLTFIENETIHNVTKL